MRRVKRVSQWGHEVIHLELLSEPIRWEGLFDQDTIYESRLELWFDPQYNYLVRRLVRHSKTLEDGKEGRGEEEVVRFAEPAPGIYFPERIERRSFIERHASGTATFTQIQVNQPLPSDIFQFRFPAGIEVLDSIRSKMYKVTPAGELEEMKDRHAFNISSGAQSVHDWPRQVNEPARPLRSQQPRGTAEMLLLAVVAVVLVINGWLLLRRNNLRLASAFQSRAEGIAPSTTNES